MNTALRNRHPGGLEHSITYHGGEAGCQKNGVASHLCRTPRHDGSESHPQLSDCLELGEVAQAEWMLRHGCKVDEMLRLCRWTRRHGAAGVVEGS